MHCAGPLCQRKNNGNAESRIIDCHAYQTEEQQPKRMPIHRLLVRSWEAVG